MYVNMVIDCSELCLIDRSIVAHSFRKPVLFRSAAIVSRCLVVSRHN